jgi:hypothetical protein
MSEDNLSFEFEGAKIFDRLTGNRFSESVIKSLRGRTQTGKFISKLQVRTIRLVGELL